MVSNCQIAVIAQAKKITLINCTCYFLGYLSDPISLSFLG